MTCGRNFSKSANFTCLVCLRFVFLCFLPSCLTSVDEHESLPQAHAQQGVFNHQAGEASRQVPLPSRHVVNDSAVPGGEQRVRAAVPLSAHAPRLRSLPVQEIKSQTKFSKNSSHSKERKTTTRRKHAELQLAKPVSGANQLAKLRCVKGAVIPPGLGPQEQLSEVGADGTQHGGVRPAQLLPRLPGVEGHVGELHAALQKPLHVLREAGLLHADGRETRWGGRGGGRLDEVITGHHQSFIAHFRQL